MAVADIIDEQDELAAHRWTFSLWPKMWSEYGGTKNITWSMVKLNKARRTTIPDRPGIYTLLVQPGIARHPANSCLMYAGKAKSLRSRFGQYLNKERKERGRPLIFRLLTKYDGHIWFCFAQFPAVALKSAEDALILAFLPPANKIYPARISKVMAAFP